MEKLVQLRKWEENDIPSLVKNANNKKISDNLRDSFPHPYNEKDAVAWIEKINSAEPITSFAIAVNGIPVGAIGVHPKADVYHRNAEFGYWLGEEYWNQGIATVAVKEMVRYAFLTFDINRLYACVFENNKASMRVLEKAGFKKEAVLRKSVAKNGLLLDEYIFCLFREEFINSDK